MVRVRYAPASRARRKKITRMAKGQRGGRSRWHRIAMESVSKALAYGTRDRRAKKRSFRRLWITRISNACKETGISYSRFTKGLEDLNVRLNRKILADIASNDKAGFEKLVQDVKQKINA